MPETDRELLERAAKAAGIEYEWHHGCGEALRLTAPDATAIYWNPLRSDADALRLAVALRLEVFQVGESRHGPARAEVCRNLGSAFGHAAEPHGSDPCAATRRAITRAAAHMGQEGSK